MKVKALSRADRKQQIVNTLLIQLQHDLPPTATVYEMAKSLNLSPSSHLRKIMIEMVAEGRLTAHKTEHRPGVFKVLFGLAEGEYTAPKKRQIALKIGGKVAGQLELWG